MIEEGDIIDIDINANTLNVQVSDEELAARKCQMAAERAEGHHRLPGTLRVPGDQRQTAARFWRYA